MLDLSHKKLDVYNMSLRLLKEVYAVTKTFPKEELFVLVSQIRRAAISICSNIAEGASRISTGEKKRFYEISRSSLVELDTQFEIAIVLHYLSSVQSIDLGKYSVSTFKMLSKMIENLRQTLLATRRTPLPKNLNH